MVILSTTARPKTLIDQRLLKLLVLFRRIHGYIAENGYILPSNPYFTLIYSQMLTLISPFSSYFRHITNVLSLLNPTSDSSAGRIYFSINELTPSAYQAVTLVDLYAPLNLATVTGRLSLCGHTGLYRGRYD